MSQTPSESISPEPGTGVVSDGTYHELLSSDRRRALLDVLAEQSPAVGLETVAAAVSDREAGPADGETVEDVAIALHHAHLPKLADAGIVDYDSVSNRVEAFDAGAL